MQQLRRPRPAHKIRKVNACPPLKDEDEGEEEEDKEEEMSLP